MPTGAEREHGGDVDYETHGHGYASLRRADARIGALVREALGSARTVLNVGAGAGSYEPSDRLVVAVEPAAAMRAQRPAHLPPAIRAYAESLPFDDASFDASMATITVHQWSDVELGLRELRRVTRGPVVVLTFDPDALDRFWLAEYAPELIAAERRRFPLIDRIGRALGGSLEVRTVPIPRDCTDGFTEAYYARPERFLDAAVRRGQSAWTFLADGVEDAIVERLESALHSGAWDARFGAFRTAPELVGSLRMVVASPAPDSSSTQPMI